MQAIKEMAKLGIGVGVLAPWVAAREIEEAFIGMCEMTFGEMHSGCDAGAFAISAEAPASSNLSNKVMPRA